MRIKTIRINNYIGVKELEKNLGKINVIKGDSGAGKTSIIEAIEKALTNVSRRKEVVRHGEEEATIYVQTTDGMEVDRRVRTEKADYLKVKHDSKAVSSTQAFLNKFLNGDIFRPLEFVNKKPEEQAKIILNMIDIPWSAEDIKTWFSEIPETDYDAHILQILKQIELVYYKERESVNREINLLKAQVQGIKNDLPPNYDGAEWEGVNLQEMYKQVTLAEENNKKLESAKSVIERLQEQIDNIEKASKNDKDSIALDYQTQRNSIQTKIKSADEYISKEQQIIDEADKKVADENKRLDSELEQAIEKLKIQYASKKQISKESILQEVELAKANIVDYEKRKATHQNNLEGLEKLEKKDIDAIEDMKKTKIEAAQEKAKEAQNIVDQAESIDIEPLRKKADEAAKMKEYLREWQRMKDIIKEKLTPKEARSNELTNKIETARKQPQELLKLAALPIEGLEVDKDGLIRINCVLLDGLSEGEKIDFAFRLAKAQAGELKLICIDGIQNLGSKAEKIMQEAATDEFQYFILETTADGSGVNIETREE